MTEVKHITITKAEYDHLKEEYEWLECLRAAGVDNWQGYDEAISIWKETHKGE